MSKVTTNQNMFSGDEYASLSQSATLDTSSYMMSVPVTKLDADQYSAADLDGVTESMFGSGNLNFLMMQASQTNDAMDLNGSSAFMDSGNLFGVDGNGPAFVMSAPANSNMPGLDLAQEKHGMTNFNTDRAAGGSDGVHTDSHGGDNAGHAAIAAGSLGASSLASNTHFAGFSSGGSGVDGSNGQDGASVSAGQDGQNGQNGNNGAPGTPGSNGDGTTIINIDIHQDGDTNIITDVTEIVNDITNIIGASDILTQVVNNVTQITNNVTNNITELLDNLTGYPGLKIELDALLEDINLDGVLSINDLPVAVVDAITDLVDTLNIGPINLHDVAIADLHTLINILGSKDTSANDFDLRVDTGLNVAGIELPGLDLDIPLDPIENFLGDIDIDVSAGLGAITNGLPDVQTIVTETLNQIVTDPLSIINPEAVNLDHLGLNIVDQIIVDLNNIGLGNDNQNGDTDVAGGIDLGVGIIDLPTLDPAIQLDVVEDLVGDIDIVPNIGLDLLGDNETNNGAGDSDVTVDLGLDLINNALPGIEIDIPLDPIEQITGDIDVDLTGGINVLGNTAQNVVDHMNGGTGNDGLIAGLGDGLETAVTPVADLIFNTIGLGVNDNGDTDLAGFIGVGAVDLDAVSVVPEINLDAVEDLVGDIDLVPALGLDLLGDSETSNSAGDTDVNVGIDLGLISHDLPPVSLEISLDPVEAITGDIDLGLGAGINVLGHTADPVIDTDQGGTGHDNLLSQIGDTLSSIVNNAPIADIAQQITGDLDTHINNAMDLLTSTPVVNDSGLHDLGVISGSSGTGGIDVIVWPESTVSNVTSAISNTVHTADTILPDPISSVSHGIGSVLDNLLGSGGGHHGGGSVHKGLFG